MNNAPQHPLKGMLSAKRLQEKADTLETNLFKSITKQDDPVTLQITISRAMYPAAVICRALLQLTPRFNINPQEFIISLQDLLKQELPRDKEETLEISLRDSSETLYDDLSMISRRFKAIASKTELKIIITGVPEVKSIHGTIKKSYFNHKQSPGQLTKDGGIDFKEINKFPIVRAGDNLFYITHEKPGKQGVAFDGTLIPVEEAQPFIIDIGPNIIKTETVDEIGKSRGYFLQAETTGVVILDRDDQGAIQEIHISEKLEVKKLDYSTGNVGTQYSCPIQMKIGVVCSGFKIRVNGKVEAAVIDGGEITTDSSAIITKAHSGSSITALEHIDVDSAAQSSITSRQGVVSVSTELIDSSIRSPRVIFEKGKGLMTNNKIETENIALSGLYFSGENIIHFGSTLFAEKDALTKSLDTNREAVSELSNTEKRLMEKLQLELKRMTKLAIADPDLVKHIKPLIMATKTMDFEIIFRQMDHIRERNNTKVVSGVQSLFEALEKIPKAVNDHDQEDAETKEKLEEIHQRMARMKLSITGFLRRAARIKIFCGALADKGKNTPDLVVESDTIDNKPVKVFGTYSPDKGFEFTQ